MSREHQPFLRLGGLLLVILLVSLGIYYRYGQKSPRSQDKHDSAETERQIDRAKLTRGRTLYRRHCRTCHGTTGRGRGPAAQFLSRTDPLDFHSDTAARYSNRQLFKKISEGKPSSGMPSWKGTLSVPDREAIVYFLQERFIEDN